MKNITLHRYFLLPFIVTALITGCSKNPVTGKSELVLVSEKQEIALGKAKYFELQQISGGDYITISEVSDYVKEVGMKLAAVSDRPQLPYEFTVLNNSVPNAWALPGGKIAINRGLLTELNDEAELAAVLSHEIVHSAARHSAKAIERNVALQTAIVILGLKDTSYSKFIAATTAFGAAIIGFQYSQAAELEADKYSIKYMNKAGYDLQGAIDLQETFLTMKDEQDSNWLVGLFSTHPPSKERLEANIKTTQLYPKGGYIGKEKYQDAIKPLVDTKEAYEKLEKGIEAFNDSNLDKALALAEEAIKIQPREGQIYNLMGRIYAQRKQYEKAIKAFDKAIDLNNSFFEFYLERGKTKQKIGDLSGAEEDLQKSRQLLPTDASLLYLGEISLTEGKKAQALKYFQLSESIGGTFAGRAKAISARLTANESYDSLKITPAITSEGDLLIMLNNQGEHSYTKVELSVLCNPLDTYKTGYIVVLNGELPPQKKQFYNIKIPNLSTKLSIQEQIDIKVVNAI